MRPLAPALLAALLLTGCTDIAGTGDGDFVPGDGKVVEVAPGDREHAVDLNGETIQGDDLDLADLRGQVVVINVWGAWCGPCRAEMPMLIEAEDELPADETAFVGINIREPSREDAVAFERDLGVEYPSIYDPGSVLLDEFGRYTPYAPPTTLVLDRSGRVAALVNGPLPSKSTLVTVVEDVLAETGDH